MSAPTVGVCGFTRSGSSMMMRMLDAGGIAPVRGSAPASYEVDHLERRAPDEPWWWEGYEPTDLARHAIKLLDTVTTTPMPQYDPTKLDEQSRATLAGAVPYWPIDWRFLWMDREPREQARSQVKFLTTVAPDIIDTMGQPDVRAIQRGLRNDRAGVLADYRRHGDVLCVQFEEVLARPVREAARIGEFLEPGWSFDIIAAASTVIDRSPACAPDMAIEMNAIERTS